MSEPYSIVDSSGSFLASIIPKQGRKEVQFYPLVSSNGLIDDTRICRHELQVDSDIVAVTWLNEHVDAAASGKKQGKKRPASTLTNADNGSVSSGSHKEAPSPTPLLAVALSSGEIWTFSPTNDARVAHVSAPEPLVSITASHTQNRVWALGESAAIFQMHVLDGEATKTIRFGKTDSHSAVICQCQYQPKRKRSSPEAELLFVASSRVYMVDGARSRGFLHAELVSDPDNGTQNDESGVPKKVSFICPAAPDGSLVAIARDDSAVLSLCDAADPSQKPVSLHCSSAQIRGVRMLKDEYLIAFTAQGAEFFSLDESASSSPVASVRAQNGVVFENFYWSHVHGVVGVWYDGNQPRFTQISASLELDGVYEIPISLKTVADAPEENPSPDITFTKAHSAIIENVPPTQLFTELSEQLLAKNVSKSAVLALCAANDNEENIKHTIRRFAYSDQSALLVETFFEIVSARVASDPSRKSSLSLWLRWVLLAHGGHIAKQRRFAENLRQLQRSLDDGMALMAKLLALQGRLQLLKSQAELRNYGINGEGPEVSDDEDQKELDAFNETFNNSTNIEESVIYANGENDEFEDALSEFPANGGEGEQEAEIAYENGEADSGEEEA